MSSNFRIKTTWSASGLSRTADVGVDSRSGRFSAAVQLDVASADAQLVAVTVSGFPARCVVLVDAVTAKILPSGKAVHVFRALRASSDAVDSGGVILDAGSQFERFAFFSNDETSSFTLALPEGPQVESFGLAIDATIVQLPDSMAGVSSNDLTEVVQPFLRNLVDANKRIEILHSELNQVSSEYVRLCGDARDRLYAFQARDRELSAVYSSTSWRLTKPVRWVLGGVKRKLSQTTPPQVATSAPYVVPEVQSTAMVETSASSVPQISSKPTACSVDVIVPVYRGVSETRRCIEAVLEHAQRELFELVVVNDCSPDPEVVHYVRELAAAGQCTLIENAVNLGFAGAVSRGMEAHPERDIVLLNADTVVNSDWLDRMLRCARSEDRIGTVTPYSNNATICSYPRICVPNEIPSTTSPAELDSMFKRLNAGVYIQIPVGVGFCMYINRRCLIESGGFDSAKFRAGYGEENDFCLRADSLGWKNVLCCDTFVYHEGAVSFQEKETRLKHQATSKILQLFPDYNDRVSQFLLKDESARCRYNVDLERIRLSEKPAILFVLHESEVGGTKKHILDLAKMYGDQFNFFCLGAITKEYICNARLWWINPNEVMGLPFTLPDDYSNLVALLKGLRVQRIHYHHVLKHQDCIKDLPRDLGVDFDFTVHDYFTVCPQIHLLDYTNEYCSEPDEKACNKCIAVAPPQQGFDGTVNEWRNRYTWLVQKADRVIVPSVDVANRIRNYFPLVSPVVAPHPDITPEERYTPVSVRQLEPSEPLRIAVLGAMSQGKGADLLEACALDARQRGLDIDFHLIGYAYRKLCSIPRARLTIHGEYEEDQLQGYFDVIKPHLVWFPARGPETYSYTLSSCLKLGMPIAATDLGALPERLAGRDSSWVLPWQTTARDWSDFFAKLATEHFSGKTAPVTESVSPTLSGDDEFYTKKYLGWFRSGKAASTVADERRTLSLSGS